MLSELHPVNSPFCEPLQKGRADKTSPRQTAEDHAQVRGDGKRLGKPFRHQWHLPSGVSQSMDQPAVEPGRLTAAGEDGVLQKAFLSKVSSDVLISPHMNPYLCFNKGCTAGSRTHGAGGKNQHITGEE